MSSCCRLRRLVSNVGHCDKVCICRWRSRRQLRAVGIIVLAAFSWVILTFLSFSSLGPTLAGPRAWQQLTALSASVA